MVAQLQFGRGGVRRLCLPEFQPAAQAVLPSSWGMSQPQKAVSKPLKLKLKGWPSLAKSESIPQAGPEAPQHKMKRDADVPGLQAPPSDQGRASKAAKTAHREQQPPQGSPAGTAAGPAPSPGQPAPRHASAPWPRG